MNIKDKIKDLFFIDTISFSERIFTCEILFKVLANKFPDYYNLSKFIDDISFGNKINISIMNPDENILYFSAEKIITLNEYNDYFSNLFDEDSLEVKIEIQKMIIDNRFTIYNYRLFTEDLLDNSLIDIMQIFSRILYGREYVIFNVLDENVYWNTKTIIFSHDLNSRFIPTIERCQRIESCKISSYFQSGIDLNILPDDFDIKADTQTNQYAEVFQKLKTILSISYISSVSSIGNGKLKCTISGQRNLSYSYDLDQVYSNGILYNIYDWIYTDGNPVDKAIIARNIISLHCKYSDLLDVDAKTLLSITENYSLYLKDNVSKYLEAKSKVSEFISDVGTKLGDNALELFNRFKNNVLAIFSFLLTVVLVNIVSENPLDNILTKEITALLELILFGSIIYFFVCLSETLYKYKKIKYAYDSLRRNYEDIFSEDELKEIFDDNQVFIKYKKSVIRNIVIFSVLWIVVIIVAVITIESISTTPFITPILGSLIELFAEMF